MLLTMGQGPAGEEEAQAGDAAHVAGWPTHGGAASGRARPPHALARAGRRMAAMAAVNGGSTTEGAKEALEERIRTRSIRSIRSRRRWGDPASSAAMELHRAPPWGLSSCRGTQGEGGR